MEARKALRAMLDSKEVILTPGVHDTLIALIVESLGFKVCFMGGWQTGASLGTRLGLARLEQQPKGIAIRL